MTKESPQQKGNRLQMKVTNVFHRNWEAIESGEYKVLCNQGGSRCFAGHQKVITRRGSIPIKDVTVGDYVLSKNGRWERVLNIFKMKNKKRAIRIKLKSGKTIEATEDHKVWFEGGWYSLKHVIECWSERNMETNTKF